MKRLTDEQIVTLVAVGVFGICFIVLLCYYLL